MFPIGLIHFKVNIGTTMLFAKTTLSSNNSSIITIVDAIFGFDPPTDLYALARAF